jgi:hypothetical protein
MSKKESEENGKGGVVESLKAVTAAIEVLTKVPKEVYSVLNKMPDYLRPNYPSAAKGFREIAKRLRESVQNVLKLLHRVVDLSSDEVNLKELRAFLKKCRSASLENIASDVKFRCGEIDNIYSGTTREWFQSFLKFRNRFAERIVKSKGAAADELVRQLTKIDAQLVDDLVKNILDPLRAYAVMIVDISDAKEQKRIHKKMQKHFRKTIDDLEESLRLLDDVVIEFGKLAHKKVNA